MPAGWLGGAVFVLALALFAWAITTITRAGSNVPTNKPTTSIVDTGPYRFTRNPIYLSMMLGLVSLAIAFDSLWLLVTLVPFFLVIRYGVVVREEATRTSSRHLASFSFGVKGPLNYSVFVDAAAALLLAA